MVMYVSMRMLLPCLSAMWLSRTFVTVDNCCTGMSAVGSLLQGRRTYAISQSGDLLDLELQHAVDIVVQEVSPLREFVENLVVRLFVYAMVLSVVL